MPMTGPGTLVVVAVHAGLVVLEVVTVLMFWHFAEVAGTDGDRFAEQVEQQRLSLEQAGRESLAEESRRDRQRTDELTALTAQVSREVADAHAGAGEVAVAVAVAGIADRLAALATAVRDIAARTQSAAGTAESGQAAAETAVRQMSRLEQSIAEIANVNQLISKIVAHTNLLAVNAVIEASRAVWRGAASRSSRTR